MYVPKHQYVKKTFLSTESRPQYEDGTPFVKASYVELSNGDTYDVPEEDLAKGSFVRAKKLIINAGTQVPGTALLLLRSFIPTVKPGQRSIRRYFVRHKVANQVIEVSEEEYKEELLNPVPYKEVVQVDWIVSGPVEDYKVKGYVYEGLKSKNKKAVLEAEKTLTGLSNYIADYAFLAQDVDKYPVEVVSDSAIFDIPSPS
jgi:hypothetical protein